MNTNLHYEYGNIKALQEAKLKLEVSNLSPIEPHKNNYSTSFMILGLTLSVACALVLTLYNPFAGISTTAGIAEPILDAVTLFKPFLR